MKFSELEEAFEFVGGAAQCERMAMLCVQTGQICFRSELSGFDEIPEEAYDSALWREVPHPKQLGLGNELVFAFIAQRLPADIDRVRSIFSRKGAYSRYKGLLEGRGILEEWYEFENASLKEAILKWCRDESIEVTE